MQKTETLTDKFWPIYLESLQLGSVLDFDLYIDIGGEIVLYRASKINFTENTRATLLENNVGRLYVAADKLHSYQRYVEANLGKIMEDTSIEESARAGVLYDSAKLLVKDVLSNPILGENIKRSKAMVESTVSFVLKGQNTFHNLLRVMSYDYSIYTHSINVCTFSLALAHFTGINDPGELNRLGTGALLHDVGKTRISESILKKPGALTSAEMEIIKKHPEWGVEIVRETNMISQESYHPIIQHHEREDKSGYPRGLDAGDIHLYSKIVAIADAFDAMTTRRVYRSAVGTFPALRTIYSKKGAFDEQLLEEFTRLMGPCER